eukprot:scaffold764_cov140-Isochrysis_galbana.AAC.4
MPAPVRLPPGLSLGLPALSRHPPPSTYYSWLGARRVLLSVWGSAERQLLNWGSADRQLLNWGLAERQLPDGHLVVSGGDKGGAGERCRGDWRAVQAEVDRGQQRETRPSAHLGEKGR